MAVELWQDHELSSGRTAWLGWEYVALESYGKKLEGITKSLVLRTPIADSHRFFAEALPFGLL